MASAKDGYEKISEIFSNELKSIDNNPASIEERKNEYRKFTGNLDKEFIATVEDVIRLTPTIVEVIVKAPLAAKILPRTVLQTSEL